MLEQQNGKQFVLLLHAHKSLACSAETKLLLSHEILSILINLTAKKLNMLLFWQLGAIILTNVLRKMTVFRVTFPSMFEWRHEHDIAAFLLSKVSLWSCFLWTQTWWPDGTETTPQGLGADAQWESWGPFHPAAGQLWFMVSARASVSAHCRGRGVWSVCGDSSWANFVSLYIACVLFEAVLHPFSDILVIFFTCSLLHTSVTSEIAFLPWEYIVQLHSNGHGSLQARFAMVRGKSFVHFPFLCCTTCKGKIVMSGRTQNKRPMWRNWPCAIKRHSIPEPLKRLRSHALFPTVTSPLLSDPCNFTMATFGTGCEVNNEALSFSSFPHLKIVVHQGLHSISLLSKLSYERRSFACLLCAV